MRIFLFTLFLALTLNSVHPIAAQSLAIRHVNLIDATGEPTQTDMTVIIVGERIQIIGKPGKVKIPAEAEVIEAAGKYLIPGLWDSHLHLTIAAGQDVTRELFAPIVYTRVKFAFNVTEPDVSGIFH
ncbi:MAG TPA: hypothetical protein VGB07_24780 [Blastocatellia bacterium]|jgi:imidazolonepropionase-like amidohydrolase